MPPLRKQHNIIGWLMDLTAVAIALVFASYLMVNDWIDNNNGPVEFLISFFALPAANVIWLQIRLGSRMPSLAFRPRREELALTFIPAHSYLATQSKGLLIRAMLPTCIAWPLLTISPITSSAPIHFSTVIFLLLMWLGSIIAGLTLSVAGVFDLLIRQCQIRSVGGVSCWLIPTVWSAVAIAALAGPLALIIVIMEAFGEPGYSVYLIILLLWIFCLIFMIVHWRNAIALYRSRRCGRAFCLLIPVTWSALTVVAPISLVLITILLPEMDYDEEEIIFLLLAIASFILTAFALITAINRWRKAIEIYYQFD